MPSLMEFLPFLRGWEFNHGLKENVPLLVGKTVRVPMEEKFPGWIRCILGSVNNPYVIIEHTVFVKPLTLTPFSLNYLGVTRPPPHGGAWIDKYDTTNNIYTVSYAPLPPQEYKPGTKIIIKHPEKDPTGAAIGDLNIYAIWWNLIQIIDEAEFRKSLKEVFGTDKVT